MCRYVCWNESYTVLVSQKQCAAGKTGKKRDTEHLDYISFISTIIQMVIQQPYQINRKILCSIRVAAYSFWKTVSIFHWDSS